MITTTEIICKQCGTPTNKPTSEIKRRIKNGHNVFFCSISCAATYNNLSRENAVKLVVKICPYCHNEFESDTGAHASTFCSRSCASLGSITDTRLLGNSKGGKHPNSAFTVDSISKGMEKREWPRYGKLDTILSTNDIPHKFETPLLGKIIVDLFIPHINQIIEFDEKYHDDARQRETDTVRDIELLKNGILVKRIKSDVGGEATLPTDYIQDLKEDIETLEIEKWLNNSGIHGVNPRLFL